MPMNQVQFRFVLKEIISTGTKRQQQDTLMIWNLAWARVHPTTGRIMADHVQLAEDAEISPEKALRALDRLLEIGAIIRGDGGQYAFNEHVGPPELRPFDR